MYLQKNNQQQKKGFRCQDCKEIQKDCLECDKKEGTCIKCDQSKADLDSNGQCLICKNGFTLNSKKD